MGKLQFMHESCLYGAFCVAEGCHDRFRAEKYQFTCAPDLDLSLAVLLLWLGVCVVYWSVSQPPLMLVGHNFNWDFYCGLTPKCQFGAAAVNFRHFLRQHTVTLWRSHIDCRWIWIGGWWHAWLSGPSTMQMSIINRRGAQGCQRCQTRIHSIGSGTHSMCALEYYMQYYILTILYQSPFEAKLSRVLGCWVCVCVCSRSRRRYDAKRTNCWLVLCIFLQPCKRARAHT